MPEQYEPTAPVFPPGKLFTGPHPQPGMSRPHVMPGVAHVFVTADGDFILNERRPSFGQALTAKRRYDVDTTDKNSRLKGKLPSSQNNFYFPYDISLAWCVHDPVAIVKRGIRDVDQVIEQSLSTPLREITTAVTPRDWAVAETRLHQRFGSGLRLDGGITVIRFAAKLTIDPGLAAHLTQEADLRGQQSLSAMRRSEIEGALQRGDYGLLVEHLTNNSEATKEVINLVLHNRQAIEQARQEMRRVLVEQGVIQDVDLERYLDWALPPTSGATSVLGGPALALTGSAGPQPAPPGAVGVGHPSAAGRSAPPVGPPPPVQSQPSAAGAAPDAAGIIAWDDVEDTR